MFRMGYGKRLLVSAALTAGGCGAIPDIIMDAGREAAKEAIEKSIEDAVGEAVEGAFNGVADDLWDLSGVSRAPEADDEGYRSADDEGLDKR